MTRNNMSPIMKTIITQFFDYRIWLLMAVILAVSIYSATIVFAQTDTETDAITNICRLYTPNVDNVVVRACASTQCAIRDSIAAGETACVVSDNVDGWYEVNIDPDNPDSLPGFISASFLSVGAGDREVVSFDYCDAYRVDVPSATVRTCSDIDCNALGSLSEGETACVVRYGADYSNWVPIAGSTSWADLVDFEYIYIEESECDVYQVRVPTTTTRTCPSLTCDVAETLSQGTQICIGEGVEEDSNWLGISYGEDTIGWVFANLMSPTTLDENSIFNQSDAIRATVNASNAVAQVSTSAPDTSDTSSATEIVAETVTVTPTTTTAVDAQTSNASDDARCTDFTVNTSAGTVRTAPSTDASQVINLPFGTTVCVTGVVPFLEDDWFIVEVENIDGEMVQAFMSQLVLNATDEVLPTPTPSPVASDNTSQVTTDNTGVAVAEPTVCPAGDTSAACIAITPTAVPQIVGVPQSVDLPLLGTGNEPISLQSPQSNATFRFFYPEDWVSTGNDVLVLNFEYFEINRSDVTTDQDLISLLDITIDDELIQSVALNIDDVGVNTLQIPLPANRMQDEEIRSHVVGFTLTAIEHCERDLTSRIEIDNDLSFVGLRYNELAPVLDLADYPRPFYEQHPTNTELVYVVIPDSPSPEELTAAGRVVAGLGSIASQLTVRTATASQLTEAEYLTNNLILVGLVGNNPYIDDLYTRDVLPTMLDADGNITRNSTIVQPDDGVVQISQHPDDPRFAILTITGQTPLAITKAGQLLAGDPPLIGLGGEVAVISTIVPSARPSADSVLSSTFTLEDIGFEEDIVLSGAGTQSAFIEFFVPFGTIDGDDAYFNLLYNNSAIMEETLSTLTVEVNGSPIASTTLRPQEDLNNTNLVFSTRSLRVNIPSTSLVPGETNFIRVIVTSQDDVDCRELNDLSTWLTISRDSEVFIPFDVAPTQIPIVGLFPSPYNFNPALSDVLVTIPENPSALELNQALTFMRRLGSSTRNVSAMNPNIVYGTPPDTFDLENYHLVVIGRPTNNPFFEQIGDSLPQPFTAGTDQLEQVLDNVVYSLDASYNVGLIQTFSSPFNGDRAVLVMTGTNDLTQALAVDIISDASISSAELLGDVIFVSREAIFPVDTRVLTRSFDTLGVVPALATESELIRQSTLVPLTETAVANVTQLAAAAPSVTPIPPTPTVDSGEDVDEQTILAATAIVARQVDATPTPIPPLEDGERERPPTAQPAWVRYFLVITIIASVVIVVGRLIIASRENSDNK